MVRKTCTFRKLDNLKESAGRTRLEFSGGDCKTQVDDIKFTKQESPSKEGVQIRTELMWCERRTRQDSETHSVFPLLVAHCFHSTGLKPAFFVQVLVMREMPFVLRQSEGKKSLGFAQLKIFSSDQSFVMLSDLTGNPTALLKHKYLLPTDESDKMARS